MCAACVLHHVQQKCRSLLQKSPIKETYSAKKTYTYKGVIYTCVYDSLSHVYVYDSLTCVRVMTDMVS